MFCLPSCGPFGLAGQLQPCIHTVREADSNALGLTLDGKEKECLTKNCFSEDWEVNHIGGTPPPHFNYLEMGFLAFYALELGLRLLTRIGLCFQSLMQRRKCFALRTRSSSLFLLHRRKRWLELFRLSAGSSPGCLESSLALCFSLDGLAGFSPFRTSTFVLLISDWSADLLPWTSNAPEVQPRLHFLGLMSAYFSCNWRDMSRKVAAAWQNHTHPVKAPRHRAVSR